MKNLKTIYTEEFFTRQTEGAFRSASVVLPVVFSQVGPPSSMLDVGCGLGAWLAAAQKLAPGLEVMGIDHTKENLKGLRFKEEFFREMDLSSAFDLKRRFDLAISLEVAEHLPSGSAKTFVEALCRHADVVLFSAAIPMQGGKHHINERFPEYWIDLFKACGYACCDTIRPAIWLNDDVSFWYQQNLFIFSKKQLPNLEGLPTFKGSLMVHPALIRKRVNRTFGIYMKYLKRRIFAKLGLPKYRDMHFDLW